MSPTSASSLKLSTEQQQTLLAAAAEVLAQAVHGDEVALPHSALEAIGDLPVFGAFVSVKRSGRLRSCCGFLGKETRLLDSLVQAARRSAADDPRFPPVSASELPYLDLEVWLLENAQPIEARGEARRSAVIVGRHGLHVSRGRSSGLLLPGVAIEHQLNAEEFLRHTCLKAGLAASAWKEDDTQVSTFEGHVIRGNLAEALRPETARELSQPSVPAVSPNELQHLSTHCGNNLRQINSGASPLYYAGGVADANVHGVVLSLLSAEGEELLQANRYSLRNRMPLQTTAFSLTEALAQAVERSTIRHTDLANMRVAVSVLSEPMLHGTAADPDLRGLDPKQRMLLALHRNKSVGVFDQTKSAAELLSEALALGRLDHPEQVSLVSLQVDSLEPRLVMSNLPQPSPGLSVRPPAQAGRFYPASAAELDELLTECLQGPPVEAQAWPAAMVPHAGLIYSGHIAGNVLRRIKIPSTVIVIGPKHTRYGVEWAVAPHERWTIPGAIIESDPDLARRLSEAIPGLELDAAAHSQEHAIEVELPFLARLAPHPRVVGIALGMADWRRCQDFATGLASVVRTMAEPPLLLISSDMNHFASDVETRRLDEVALRAMESLDPQTLLDTVTREHITMCGVIPATIVMETLRQLGWLNRIERVGYSTSGDTTGDRSRVVGYAGMLLGGPRERI